MRGEARCNLDELIRAERRAASAVKGLGIVEAKPAREERGPSAIERLRAHMEGLVRNDS